MNSIGNETYTPCVLYHYRNGNEALDNKNIR